MVMCSIDFKIIRDWMWRERVRGQEPVRVGSGTEMSKIIANEVNGIVLT